MLAIFAENIFWCGLISKESTHRVQDHPALWRETWLSACLVETKTVNVDSPLKCEEECPQEDTGFLLVELAKLLNVLTLTNNYGFGWMEK